MINTQLLPTNWHSPVNSTFSLGLLLPFIILITVIALSGALRILYMEHFLTCDIFVSPLNPNPKAEWMKHALATRFYYSTFTLTPELCNLSNIDILSRVTQKCASGFLFGIRGAKWSPDGEVLCVQLSGSHEQLPRGQLFLERTVMEMWPPFFPHIFTLCSLWSG